MLGDDTPAHDQGWAEPELWKSGASRLVHMEARELLQTLKSSERYSTLSIYLFNSSSFCRVHLSLPLLLSTGPVLSTSLLLESSCALQEARDCANLLLDILLECQHGVWRRIYVK